MASADMPVERTMFVRKATGLVKGWSVFDAFIYATLSINLITLGFGYAFTGIAVLPESALIAAVVLSALFIVFEVIVYASLVAVMPRAGGDYVWQTRILGGGIGFVMAATGWWFILSHWVPIYANILAVEVIQPTLTILGYTGTSAFHADWWPYSATRRERHLLHVDPDRDPGERDHRPRHAQLRQDPEVLLLRRHGRARADDPDLPDPLASGLHHRLQHVGPQPVRREGRRLPPDRRCRRRLLDAGLRLVPGQGDVPAPAVHRLLQPVAELGRDAVRRGPRGERLPQEHLRDGRGARLHDRDHGHHPRSDGPLGRARLLRDPERRVLADGGEGAVLHVPLPGNAGRLLLHERARPADHHLAARAVVPRLGRDALPVVDADGLRGGLRPDAARVGGEGRRSYPRSARRAGAHVRPRHHRERALRVQHDVLRLHARRDARDRGDVLRDDVRRHHPAVHEARPLPGFADREVRHRRGAADHRHRRRVPRRSWRSSS